MPQAKPAVQIRFCLRFAVICVLVAIAGAMPSGATRYVSATGSDTANDCTNSAAPCATIQWAVDQAAAAEEVKVAAGTYSGSATEVVTRDMEDYTYRQVVFIDKALSLLGGFSESDWDTPDPASQVTTIDALADGRPITIVDTLDQSVVVDGFTLTGGDSTGWGNPPGLGYHICADDAEVDCGGGLYVYDSAFELLNSTVASNAAGTGISDGGGIYLWQPHTTTLDRIVVQGNTATEDGGGLFVTRAYFPMTLRRSSFVDNTAGRGGGIDMYSSIQNLVRIEDCDLTGNSATGETSGGGGGMHIRLTMNGLNLVMERVVFESNEAWDQGKGLALDAAGPVTPDAQLINVLFLDNDRIAGSPIATEDAVFTIGPGFASLNVTLAHLTAAENPVGSFLYVIPPGSSGLVVDVAASNVLLSGFENGYVAEESGGGEVTIEHTNTLFHQVTNHHLTLAGTPTFTEVNPVIGDPLLFDGYLLQAGSAAIDAGVDVGVTDDLDGDPRPFGPGFDIGVDEYLPPVFSDGFESGDTSAWTVTVP
jgi:hypothetical protein